MKINYRLEIVPSVSYSQVLLRNSQQTNLQRISERFGDGWHGIILQKTPNMKGGWKAKKAKKVKDHHC